jgi:Fe-S-cluster-containing hydrogenase component 2/CRP-like cAMP-binding protein
MDETILKGERPGRWDSPLDPGFSEADLDRLLATAPFRDMNPESFPRRQPLRAILQNDSRIRRFRRGELIVRAGDFGSSAFMILNGSVRVVLPPGLPDAILGRRAPAKKSLFRIIAQLWANHRHPEVRTPEELGSGDHHLVGEGAEARVFLQDVPRLVDQHKTVTVGAGEFFGEIAALSRMPRTATIFADTDDTELLEVRWQGLRDLLKYDPTLRAHIDALYRKNTLSNALRSFPLFQHLNEEQLARVAAQTQFGTFGDYDWSGDYKRLAQAGTQSPERETLIAQEGDYPDGVVFVRSGFARLTKRFANGQRTLNYLGAGRSFGLREIAHNWRHPDRAVAFQSSLRVIGYTHTLFVPTHVMEEIVLPGAPASAFPQPFPETAASTAEEEIDPLREQGGFAGRVGPELMEFLTGRRYFNGTATMVINLERCTRCDDCVRACASTHDNNPRFLRHGPVNSGIQVAQACMHCVDPVCMIGCPTGAIHRDASGGNVVINQSTCIGCTSCANNCPYEAIRMVEARNERGGFVVDADMRPIAKATKCDLCIDQYGGPACERACPHDALTRINLTRLDQLAEWLHR